MEEAAPVVECDPSHRYGFPHVRGVEVGVYADLVWAGMQVDGVAEFLGVRRCDVLVACWYVVRHGTGNGLGLRTKRGAAWGPWVESNWMKFWRGAWDEIPDPPHSTTLKEEA